MKTNLKRPKNLLRIIAHHMKKVKSNYGFLRKGFDLQPSVPYAWQPVGETIEVPSQPSRRLKVRGFLTADNRYESFCVNGHVNTDVVTAGFDAFARRDSARPTVVMLDNASVHTSHRFLNRLPGWETQGGFVRYLPAYGSALHRIEILWRFIKPLVTF